MKTNTGRAGEVRRAGIQRWATSLLEQQPSFAGAVVGGRQPARPIPLRHCLNDALLAKLEREDLTVEQLVRWFRGTWTSNEVRTAIDELEAAGRVDVIPTHGIERVQFTVCLPIGGGK